MVYVRNTKNPLSESDTKAQPRSIYAPSKGGYELIVKVCGSLRHDDVVRNAIRPTAPGTGVSISMDASDEQVVMLVADLGTGVPEDVLGRIFESLYRIEDGRETRSGSSGIGLAIVSRAVRLHGGQISASNIQGIGLSVVLT